MISPEDPEVMEQYCEFMEEYLSQGLLEEQIERVQRQRYEQLLEKEVKTSGRSAHLRMHGQESDEAWRFWKST